MVQGALVSGEKGDSVRREMIKRRSAAEAALRERFARALSDGDLPPDCERRQKPAGFCRSGTGMTQAD
jgi:hypothetical protein